MMIGRNVNMPKTTRLGTRNAQGRRRMPRKRWSIAIGVSPRPKTRRSRRSVSALSGGVRSACIVIAPLLPHRRRQLVLDVGGDALKGLVGGDLAGDRLAQPIGDRNQHHAV